MSKILQFFNTYRYFILLHFTVFLWGYTGVLGKLIQASSIEITLLRTSIAFISLMLYLIYTKKLKRIAFKKILQYLGIGCLIGFHWFAFFESIHQSNVSVALTCLASSSLFVAILNPFVGKARKFRTHEFLLGLLAIFGIYIVFNFESQYTLGIILGLVTSFFGALFTILNGNLIDRGDTAVEITVYEMLGAFLCVGFCSFFFNENMPLSFDLNLEDWVYVLILGTVCTAFAFMLGIYVMKEVSAYTVTITVNLEPLYSILLALWIFKEEEYMSSGFYIGGAIIMLSIFLNAYLNRKQRKKDKKAHEERR
ncbi:MAG: DMT family transporter [Flavobacteriales bacterium]